MPRRFARSGTSRAGKFRRLTALLTAGTALWTLSGCGLLSGSEGGSDAGGNGKLEQATIDVGSLPSLSKAPLVLAQEKGYFKQEGLKVNDKTVGSGPAGVNSLIGGDIDMVHTSYTPLIKAQSQSAGNLKIVSEMQNSAPNMMSVMAMPDSDIQSPQDMVGKDIAITATGAITDLGTRSALRDRGIDPNGVNFVEMGFSDMPNALKTGQVDGAVMTEPYVTKTAKSSGARAILDGFSGSTEDFPVAGIATTSQFAEENPETVKAFQRAIQKAQRDAQDRQNVIPVLPKFAKVPPDIAPMVEMGNFPTTTEASRLQRVPALMLRFNLIDKEVNVSDMILSQPGGK